MRRWGESTGTRGRSAAASAAVLCALLVQLGAGASLLGADDDRLSSNVRLRSGLGRALVLEAARGAARRLARPGCQKLLTDFADEAGQPLAAALERRGLAAPDYLGRLYFYGATRGQCAASRSLAFTRPGSRVIFSLCGEVPRAVAAKRRLRRGRDHPRGPALPRSRRAVERGDHRTDPGALRRMTWACGPSGASTTHRRSAAPRLSGACTLPVHLPIGYYSLKRNIKGR